LSEPFGFDAAEGTFEPPVGEGRDLAPKKERASSRGQDATPHQAAVFRKANDCSLPRGASRDRENGAFLQEGTKRIALERRSETSGQLLRLLSRDHFALGEKLSLGEGLDLSPTESLRHCRKARISERDEPSEPARQGTVDGKGDEPPHAGHDAEDSRARHRRVQ
jgi:hypothetical protein